MLQNKISFDPTSVEDVNELIQYIKSLPCFKTINSIPLENSRPCDGIDSMSTNSEEEVNDVTAKEITRLKEVIANLQVELDKKNKLISELSTQQYVNKESCSKEQHNILKLQEIEQSEEKFYFQLKQDGSLKRTVICADALFFATKDGKQYNFMVNVENGPVRSACQQYQTHLLPFCELQDYVMGADTIICIEPGIGELKGSEFSIINKAKISLIKQ